MLRVQPRALARLAGHRYPHVRKMSSSAPLLIESDQLDGAPSGVRILTLNRPDKLNPMTEEMGDAVVSAVEELSSLSPADLRAVVITGSGRAFSAGGDMGFLNNRKEDNPTNNANEMRAFYNRFLSIRKLVRVLLLLFTLPRITTSLAPPSLSPSSP